MGGHTRVVKSCLKGVFGPLKGVLCLVEKSCHSRFCGPQGSGICCYEKRDPRLQASGMTGNFKGEAPNKNAFRAPLRSGFTLIELLVVVLIIGILAAIALSQYQKAVEKTRAVQGFVKIDALEKAQRAYYLENGTFTIEINNLDITQKGMSCHLYGKSLSLCQWSVSKNMLFEWHGEGSSGKTQWFRLAKTANEIANQLCSTYWESWGKSGSPYEKDGYTYYWSNK